MTDENAVEFQPADTEAASKEKAFSMSV